MTYLTPSRDTLAEALHGSDTLNPERCSECRRCIHEADRLIASGAVIDAATLADDEALVEAVAGNIWEDEPTRTEKRVAVSWLHALTVALTEREVS